MDTDRKTRPRNFLSLYGEESKNVMLDNQIKMSISPIIKIVERIRANLEK